MGQWVRVLGGKEGVTSKRSKPSAMKSEREKKTLECRQKKGTKDKDLIEKKKNEEVNEAVSGGAKVGRSGHSRRRD